MFANQRRARSGQGTLAAVAAIIVLWLAGAGVFLKVYREGGAPAVLCPSGEEISLRK